MPPPMPDALDAALQELCYQLCRGIYAVAGDESERLPRSGGASLRNSDVSPHPCPTGPESILVGTVELAWHQERGWQAATRRLQKHLAAIALDGGEVIGFGVQAMPNEDGAGYLLTGSVRVRCSVPYTLAAG